MLLGPSQALPLLLSACRWGSSFVEMVRALERRLTDAVKSDVKLWVDIFAGGHASCPQMTCGVS